MKTVKKALDILEVFLNRGEEIGVAELSEITGQNISTTHGILLEFASRGYIRQQKKRGKYSLGLKFLSFSGAMNDIISLADMVRPFMVELSNLVGETVNIAINNNNNAFTISIVHATHKLRVVTDDKKGIPLFCTGVGKVFLAAMSDEELGNYLNSEKLISYTPNTITDINKIKREIHKIRLEGVAYDIDEWDIGIRNIAAPLKDHNGKVIAAIGAIGPSIRISKKRAKEIAPMVKKYAEEISKVLGFEEGRTR